MKLRLFSLALIFLAARVVSAQTAARPFQIAKITRNLISTPEYQYEGADTFRTNLRDRWLAIDVQFSAAPAFTKELTFKYYILINGQLLTGEVTHVNILEGRELYSVMYIPPRALAHITGNRLVTVNSVENVAVQLLEQGEVKEEASMNRARAQWFAALPAVAGFVLNKNETPFAPLSWDHYEQIKPTGAR